MRKLCIVSGIFILSACSTSDSTIRDKYSGYYSQDEEYVQQFAKEIDGLSVQQLAIDGAKKDKAKMQGQSRLRIDKYLYVEDVKPENNKVIFEYSLDAGWWKSLSDSKKITLQRNMSKDLIYRTCSLKTVRLSQEKGLEENHRYYYDYSNKKLAFELKTNKVICLENGFK
ncbi:TPA: hypothetical protein ACU21B_001740 [Mannheimia haemolytica]